MELVNLSRRFWLIELIDLCLKALLVFFKGALLLAGTLRTHYRGNELCNQVFLVYCVDWEKITMNEVSVTGSSLPLPVCAVNGAAFSQSSPMQIYAKQTLYG
jgi:hypothetical protein